MLSVGTVLGCLLLVLGFTSQNVTIVYWTESDISPYGILLYANVFFTLFFGLLLAAFAACTRDASALLVADAPRQRSLLSCSRTLTLAQLSCCVGLLNILNGFLIVYASPPDRTPPLIQAILQNSGVLFAVPASKLVLGDRKAYCARAPVLAASLIAASVAVSVLPTIIAGASGEFSGGAAQVAWIAVYLGGILPGACYNVVQQLFLIRAGALAPGVSRLGVARASLRALFYCNLSQLLWLGALWFLDILPWFGASSSAAEFASNTAFSLRCSLGLVAGDAACAAAHGAPPAVWAAAFAAAYCVSYVGSVLLNRESASFNMLCAVITTALTSAFFLIPGTNPNASNTPLWSVLTSLAFSAAGLVLWKRWEAATPAEEQFAAADGDVADADRGGGRGGGGGLSGPAAGGRAALADGAKLAPLLHDWA